MATFKLSRIIVRALKDDADAVAAIRAEFSALALEIATNPDAGFELTSSTVNGQTFSGSRDMSKADRLSLLNDIVIQLDAGATFSTRTRTVF